MTATLGLYLLDPTDSAPWMPFAGTRPIAELRAGAWLLRERWEQAAGITATAVLAPGLEGMVDTAETPVANPFSVPGPAIVACSDFAVAAGYRLPGTWDRLVAGGRAVAWRVPAGAVWDGPHETGTPVEAPGLLLKGTWDLLTALEQLLQADLEDHLREGSPPTFTGVTVLGDPEAIRAAGAAVEPTAVLDTRAGPIVLEASVVVRAGTRLEGPLIAHRDTWLLGGAIRHCSIGPACRVHGEVASSVFIGYSNKSHDGFLGHSVLGQWVNLGAGTITSNLKNTYGPIVLHPPTGRIPTGRTFCGTLFGDHVKTAIGTLLSTGTIVGAGASLHGPGPVPAYVPPFQWGATGNATQTLEGFLTTASRVFPRRGIAWTDARQESLRRLHARATGHRDRS